MAPRPRLIWQFVSLCLDTLDVCRTPSIYLAYRRRKPTHFISTRQCEMLVDSARYVGNGSSGLRPGDITSQKLKEAPTITKGVRNFLPTPANQQGKPQVAVLTSQS